jgi:hypothetical protein
VTFNATVDGSASPYLLWNTGTTWPRLPVALVKAVKGPWAPLGEYPTFDSYRTGVLSADLAIPTGLGSVAFAKGASVSFGNESFISEFSVSAISGALARDFSPSLYGTKALFKAGSTAALSDSRFTGVLAQDAKLRVDGNVLFAPKGSNLFLEENQLVEGNLAPKATFTVGTKVYACAAGLIVQSLDVEKGEPVPVRVTTAKDYPLKVGTTSFTLPAGSLITFAGPAIQRVIFVKDSKVTLAGTAETVVAGTGFSFDAKGTPEKIKAE